MGNPKKLKVLANIENTIKNFFYLTFVSPLGLHPSLLFLFFPDTLGLANQPA
jgi:hypothetical protein